LIRLANNSSDDVRKLATDLLGEKDPRTGVGLDAWGQLLETEHGHKFAADSITKHFGAAELTPAWFQGRLLSHSDDAFEFAKKLLPKTHDLKALGAPFFIDLLRKADPDRDSDVAERVGEYATDQLAKFDLNAVPQDQLHWLALFPASAGAVDDWMEKGKLKPQRSEWTS
jgi:hypothetical protein